MGAERRLRSFFPFCSRKSPAAPLPRPSSEINRGLGLVARRSLGPPLGGHSFLSGRRECPLRCVNSRRFPWAGGRCAVCFGRFRLESARRRPRIDTKMDAGEWLPISAKIGGRNSKSTSRSFGSRVRNCDLWAARGNNRRDDTTIRSSARSRPLLLLVLVCFFLLCFDLPTGSNFLCADLGGHSRSRLAAARTPGRLTPAAVGLPLLVASRQFDLLVAAVSGKVAAFINTRPLRSAARSHSNDDCFLLIVSTCCHLNFLTSARRFYLADLHTPCGDLRPSSRVRVRPFAFLCCSCSFTPLFSAGML